MMSEQALQQVLESEQTLVKIFTFLKNLTLVNFFTFLKSENLTLVIFWHASQMKVNRHLEDFSTSKKKTCPIPCPALPKLGCMQAEWKLTGTYNISPSANVGECRRMSANVGVYEILIYIVCWVSLDFRIGWRVSRYHYPSYNCFNYPVITPLISLKMV